MKAHIWFFLMNLSFCKSGLVMKPFLCNAEFYGTFGSHHYKHKRGSLHLRLK